MIITEFAKFVDQRMEELGTNRTLLIRNSGMTASGTSQILKRAGVPALNSIDHMSVTLNVPPEKLFHLTGYLPPKPDGGQQG